MSVKLDNPSTRWIYLSVGTATIASLAAGFIALHADTPEGLPLLNGSFTVAAVLWFGALAYCTTWWIRRFICKAVKTLRKSIVEDVVAAGRTMDVDRWRRAADEAEPHLKSVSRN